VTRVIRPEKLNLKISWSSILNQYEEQNEKYNTIYLNWRMKLKPIKLLQKSQGKELKIQWMKIELGNIIFDKLKLNNEIANK
jgi:urease accessory protein UreE